MHLIKDLKKQGYRLTKPREAILKKLNHKPSTVQEIFNSLKKSGIDVDLASVYRSLDLFVKMNIVNVVELGEGKKRYELIDTDHHHHHVICNDCGAIEDIQINEDALLKDVSNKTNFKINKHSLEFFGVCSNCQ